MSHLTPVDEALTLLATQISRLAVVETRSLAEALNCILATDVTAAISVPPADNSAMDGYAVNAEEIKLGNSYVLGQRIPAGVSPQPLVANTVARIFTGAEIPAGADAVIMQENAELLGDGVRFISEPKAKDNVRPAGQDIQQGDVILAQGKQLLAQDLGLLASIGVAQVSVYKPLRIAIFSSGDELVEPGNKLEPGQIYNSNRAMLKGLIETCAYECLDFAVVKDDLQATKSLLIEAATVADVVIATGGMSVGEEDHLKAAVNAVGSIDLWKLAIKPGKPFAFGEIHADDRRVPFMGLPGNPVAVFVTFNIVAKPLLAKMQGQQRIAPLELRAKALFERPRKIVRQEYLRAIVAPGDEGVLTVDLLPNQSSGVLSSVCAANALVIVPSGETVSQGDSVRLLLL